MRIPKVFSAIIGKKGKKESHQRFKTRNAQAANMGRKNRQSRITDFFQTDNEDIRTFQRTIDQTLSKIACFQANNQKRIESCEKLALYCDKKDNFLVLGQEPSTFGMQITGLNRNHTIIPGG